MIEAEREEAASADQEASQAVINRDNIMTELPTEMTEEPSKGKLKNVVSEVNSDQVSEQTQQTVKAKIENLKLEDGNQMVILDQESSQCITEQAQDKNTDIPKANLKLTS